MRNSINQSNCTIKVIYSFRFESIWNTFVHSNSGFATHTHTKKKEKNQLFSHLLPKDLIRNHFALWEHKQILVDGSQPIPYCRLAFQSKFLQVNGKLPPINRQFHKITRNQDNGVTPYSVTWLRHMLHVISAPVRSHHQKLPYLDNKA